MGIVSFLGFVFLIIFILKTLCHLSSKTKFYVKFSLYFISVGLISIPILFLCLFRPRHVDNIRYFYSPLKSLSWMLGVQFEIRDKHHVPTNSPCILVSNHRADLDPLGIVQMDFWNVTFLVRKENLINYGPFGWATWLCGAIFVDRFNPKSAKKSLKQCADTIRTKKVKLWIFPEGFVNAEKNNFLPFKKGAFNLAVEMQVPIVPIVFSSYHYFYSIEEARFDTGKVILTCMPPVSTVGLTYDDVNELTERVRGEMLDVFRRTSEEFNTE